MRALFLVSVLLGAGLWSCSSKDRGCDRSLSRLRPETTLLAKCSPYTPPGDVVLDGVTVSVEPGVELRFVRGAKLRIGEHAGGKLIARGTGGSPIRLTGDGWGGVHVFAHGDGTALQNVQLVGTHADEALRVEASEVELNALEIPDAQKTALALMTPGPVVGFQGVKLNGPVHGELLHASLCGASVLSRDELTLPSETIVTLHGDVTKDLTLHPIDGTYRLPETAQVDAAGDAKTTLRLEAGVTLALGEGVSLRLGGNHGPVAFEVAGTEAAPVTITHLEEGNSDGVVFLSGAAPPSIEWLILEHAGAARTAAMRWEGAAGLGSITHSQFRHLPGGALDVTAAGAPFTAFDHDTFEGVGDTALRIPLALAGGLGTENTFGAGARVVLFGTASADLELSAIGPPYVVDSALRLEGAGDRPPAIVFAPGTAFLFTPEGSLELGQTAPVKLSAVGDAKAPIVFGAQGEPWKGVVVGPHGNVELKHARIEKVAAGAYPLTLEKGATGTVEALTLSETHHGVRRCGQVKVTQVTAARGRPGVEGCR